MTTISNAESGSSVRTKLNNTGVRKNNFAATTNPAVTDDSASGYEAGSIWLNTTTGDSFYAKSVGVGAAVWILVLSSSGDAALPSKASLVAADKVIILDSAASDAAKYVLASEVRRETLVIACSDETTSLTVGTAKVTFRMPWAMTLTAIRASVTTAPTGASLLTVNVKETGTTILSTKLTFDASEKTTTTAATPPVISDSSLADDAEMTVDIDVVGSTVAGAGLKVYLIGYRT